MNNFPVQSYIWEDPNIVKTGLYRPTVSLVFREWQFQKTSNDND